MKFNFDKTDTKGGWVAAVYEMDGNSGKYCLCIKTSFKDEEVWLYYDGEVSVQAASIPISGEPVKKFYHGDKITITF